MEATRVYQILIVGDSRVRNLERYIENLSPFFEFTIRCIPGARIERLGLHARASLSYQVHYDLVLIAGGINDITKLKYRPVRHATLRYTSTRRICAVVIAQLRELMHKSERISDTPVVIASIPGMCLINYSPAVWYNLINLQPILDSTMVELNRQIRGLNRMNGFPTPNLSYPVHRCAGNRGRYYAHYAHLVDGLHPGETLLVRWAQHITNYCMGLFQIVPPARRVQE